MVRWGLVIPKDLTQVEDSNLESLARHLQYLKRCKQREIDDIDTELIGLKEELRTRKEKQSIERSFQNSFTEE